MKKAEKSLDGLVIAAAIMGTSVTITDEGWVFIPSIKAVLSTTEPYHFPNEDDYTHFDWKLILDAILQAPYIEGFSKVVGKYSIDEMGKDSQKAFLQGKEIEAYDLCVCLDKEFKRELVG